MREIDTFCTVEELLEYWKQKHWKEGKTKFIADGIVNAEVWRAKKVKVCFLLKECYFDSSEYEKDKLLPDGNLVKHHWNTYISCQNGHYVYDLAKHLKEHAPWFMWYRVENWAKRFFPLLGLDTVKPLQSIAVVNIKKSEGTDKSDYGNILSYAKNDRDLIRKELELIDPDVIICGATYDYCIKAGLFNAPQELASLQNFGNRKIARDGKRIILDCYHPSAPGISYEKVDSFFKEAFQCI